MVRDKLKLYCGKCHYATVYLDEVKNMIQNKSYWYIEMKDGDVYADCTNAVITKDQSENIGYFVNISNN